MVSRLDDPLAFVDPQRVDASLLWFSEGFVEYKAPNNLTEEQEPQMLEFSMEMASEFPYSNNIWASDLSQYGLLKHIRINNTHCTIGGENLSNVTLPQLKIKENKFIDFRIEVSSDAKNKGGVTIFGKDFGNYPQDIVAKLYYTPHTK